jgi:hypothetical protein
LSESSPKKIPDENPNTVRISVFTSEYSALNIGKFLPKNMGRQYVMHEPPRFLKNAPTSTHFEVGLSLRT